VSAADGQEAVDAFARDPHGIAAVLLDMTMPRLNGAQVFEAIRRIRPDIRVLLSSGYTEADAARQFRRDGVAGFIQKPYRPSELVRHLQAVLE
jgi:CheY-like chemotaxis protein